MNSPLRAFAVMLVVTVFAAGLAGWGGVEYGLHRNAEVDDLDTLVHHDLNLSTDQAKDIEQLETAFASDRMRLQAEMTAANKDLARIMTGEHIFGAHAEAAIARYHAASAELQTRTVRHVLAMRAVLTPEQARRFDDTVRNKLSAEAP